MSFSNSLYEENEIPSDQEMKKSKKSLIRENEYLKQQILILKNEKEMHISQNAKENLELKSNLRQLQDRLVLERNQFKKNIEDLNIKLKILKKSMDLMVENKRNAKQRIDEDNKESQEKEGCLKKNKSLTRGYVRGKNDTEKIRIFSSGHKKLEE